MGSLDTLPKELLVDIMINLDPVGLISLSQTSTYFRNFINPTKQEFVERLLQLELTEEFGGPAFEFCARYFLRVQRLWASEQWRAIRWACTGCMRLLSHVHFDNRSLLRLEFRKPSPGLSDNTLTTWRVTLYGKQWSSRDQHTISDQERKRRKRHLIADSYSPGSFDLPEIYSNLEALRGELGFEGFDDLNEEQFRALPRKDTTEIFDRNIASIESERCGLKRHLRKCNECKYQGNQIRRGFDGLGGGTPTVPIQISRKIRFFSGLHRYFPNYWTGLRTRRPSTDGASMKHLRGADQDWNLFMARCPGCERWQEVRAFRMGSGSRIWRPEPGYLIGSTNEGLEISEAFLDSIRCNACFAQAHGREGLAAALLPWYLRLVENHRSDVEYETFWGLSEIKRVLESLPVEAQPAVQSILNAMIIESETATMFHPNNREALQSLHGQFKRIWYGLPVDFLTGHQESVLGFDYWNREFTILSDYWAWLHVSTKEIEENPQVLVNWALSQDVNALN